MMWRIRLLVIGAVLFVIGLAALPFNMKGATAAPLLQQPPTSTFTPPALPTDTPIAPTDTPIPTDTPFPTDTPIGSTPPAGTSTPIPPTREPRPGGGGGAPPGPSGTPVVNGCVRSIGRNGISLSAEPGFYQPHVQIIPRDRLALVLAGPERADTIWWWRLRTDAGVEGWGNQDEMTPDPGPCAFGTAGSSGGPTPPYPVTILPSFSFAQTPASEPSSVQVAPPAQTTPAQQETLPQTGGSVEWWFWAALLAIIVIVVGVVRRRLQTQFVVNSRSPQDDETDTQKL